MKKIRRKRIITRTNKSQTELDQSNEDTEIATEIELTSSEVTSSEIDEYEYDVGYGKPPKKHQFPKGQSGNPNGRPKGTKNFKTDLKEELSEKILISEGGKTQHISKQRAIIKRIFEKALKGDTKASEMIVRWLAQYLGIDDTTEETKQISPDDQTILDRFIAEMSPANDDDTNKE